MTEDRREIERNANDKRLSLRRENRAVETLSELRRVASEARDCIVWLDMGSHAIQIFPPIEEIDGRVDMLLGHNMDRVRGVTYDGVTLVFRNP